MNERLAAGCALMLARVAHLLKKQPCSAIHPQANGPIYVKLKIFPLFNVKTMT